MKLRKVLAVVVALALVAGFAMTAIAAEVVISSAGGAPQYTVGTVSKKFSFASLTAHTGGTTVYSPGNYTGTHTGPNVYAAEGTYGTVVIAGGDIVRIDLSNALFANKTSAQLNAITLGQITDAGAWGATSTVADTSDWAAAIAASGVDTTFDAVTFGTFVTRYNTDDKLAAASGEWTLNSGRVATSTEAALNIGFNNWSSFHNADSNFDVGAGKYMVFYNLKINGQSLEPAGGGNFEKVGAGANAVYFHELDDQLGAVADTRVSFGLTGGVNRLPYGSFSDLEFTANVLWTDIAPSAQSFSDANARNNYLVSIIKEAGTKKMVYSQLDEETGERGSHAVDKQIQVQFKIADGSNISLGTDRANALGAGAQNISGTESVNITGEATLSGTAANVTSIALGRTSGSNRVTAAQRRIAGTDGATLKLTLKDVGDDWGAVFRASITDGWSATVQVDKGATEAAITIPAKVYYDETFDDWTALNTVINLSRAGGSSGSITGASIVINDDSVVDPDAPEDVDPNADVCDECGEELDEDGLCQNPDCDLYDGGDDIEDPGDDIEDPGDDIEDPSGPDVTVPDADDTFKVIMADGTAAFLTMAEIDALDGEWVLIDGALVFVVDAAQGTTDPDENVKTGVALAIVPALIAGAAAVVARKRK